LHSFLSSAESLGASQFFPWVNRRVDEVADRLTQLIPGFTFEPEISGRFEEVPASVAQRHGMEFILMGAPEDETEGETSDEYVLEFECETDLPIEVLLAQDEDGFARRFVGAKTVDERGFMDCWGVPRRVLSPSPPSFKTCRASSLLAKRALAGDTAGP